MTATASPWCLFTQLPHALMYFTNRGLVTSSHYVYFYVFPCLLLTWFCLPLTTTITKLSSGNHEYYCIISYSLSLHVCIALSIFWYFSLLVKVFRLPRIYIGVSLWWKQAVYTLALYAPACSLNLTCPVSTVSRFLSQLRTWLYPKNISVYWKNVSCVTLYVRTCVRFRFMGKIALVSTQ